ncbi:hypothetical protein [Microbacterium binotii]|uniref:hypothetical protein n=1 Tax=Microbacterium binotii TaxID=462710 RepID=UPI001F3FA12A|nr:hypothetical protein [Microbacterium binotii]UIN31761.1 hypothetical protein LXM64_06125 [Microbacterium binotii]
MSASPTRPSPRTNAAPMAFTFREFARGACMAWLWFLLFSTLASAAMLYSGALIALIYAVPWSLAALLIGSPLAYGLGWMLRTAASVPLHLVAFTVFGAVVGIGTTTLAFTAPWSDLSGDGMNAVSVPAVAMWIAATIAVPLGWRFTSKRALRGDTAELGAVSPA